MHFASKPLIVLTLLALSLSANAADRECRISQNSSGLMISEKISPAQSIIVADGLRESEKLVEIMNVLTSVKQCTFPAQTCDLERFQEGGGERIGIISGGEHSIEFAARYTINIGSEAYSSPVKSAYGAVRSLRILVDGQICKPLFPQHCQVEAAPDVASRAALQVVRGAIKMSVLATDIKTFVNDLTSTGYCSFN